jgi:hypothetical protein
VPRGLWGGAPERSGLARGLTDLSARRRILEAAARRRPSSSALRKNAAPKPARLERLCGELPKRRTPGSLGRGTRIHDQLRTYYGNVTPIRVAQKAKSPF